MAAMIQAMRRGPGVVGARQAGAGFGGCMVAFVEAGSVETFVAHVTESDQMATNIAPELYPVEAAAGAGPLLSSS
jgi:galactokinase